MAYRAMYDEYAHALVGDNDPLTADLSIRAFKLWGISDFLDYRDENPPKYLVFYFEAATLWGPLTYEELTKRDGPFQELTFFRPPDSGEENSKRFALITVDLELFKSKDVDFNREMLSLQDQYRKSKASVGKKTRSRADTQLLDRILKAHDLKKENPELTNYQITSELLSFYETPDNRGPGNNSKKVEDDLKAATKYIRQAPYIPFNFD
ncbi:MAG: hypothetical protein AB7F66_10960 [Bacteriovoracia bacterium]